MPTLPASVLLDTAVVTNFRTGAPSLFLDRMNRDLGLRISEKDCLLLQHFFTTTAMRDPTVGELRVLDALTHGGLHDPSRIAVGELTTQSPALAEIWADMMHKHALCHGIGESIGHAAVGAPPCTLTDALNLTGRYLRRAPKNTLLLSDPRREAVAAAEGYVPVTRVTVGSDVVSVWTRKTPRRSIISPRTGDFLFYIPRASTEQIQNLLASEAKYPRPLLADIRAISQSPLLLMLADLYPAVDLYAARLTDQVENGLLPVKLLCTPPAVPSDSACGYLLRVPMKQVQTINPLLKELGIASVVCGQIRTGGNTVVYVRDADGTRDVPAVTLPSELLRTSAIPRLYVMKPEAVESSVTPVSPALARLPSRIPGENGLTPDGRETVALTRHEGHVLPIPEAHLFLHALTVSVSRPENAFSASAETVVQASQALADLGMPIDSIHLSVALSVPSVSELTEGPALSAICGIYCAAAQLSLPVDEPTIAVSDESTDLRVTVTAWSQDAERFVELSRTTEAQWHTNASPANSAQTYVLPVLRRTYEDSLKALAAALNYGRKAACSIRPLAMNAIQDEATGVNHYSLHPESQQKLLEELDRPDIPIFSMKAEDTRLLLSHLAVTEALHRRVAHGQLTIVLGESCKPFAEHGLLPAALLAVDTIRTTADCATVTYTFPASPSTRLIRTPLLAPVHPDSATVARHLLTLHLPDGRIIPDGFSGAQGTVLGLLNGLDTETLTRLPGISLYL